MFGSEAIPAALFALLICFVPETPRYLVMIGKDERALNILSKINGTEKANHILQEIKSTITVRTEKLLTYGWVCIFIGIMLSVFQQIVGINAMARALLSAAALFEESELPAMKKERYASFDSGIGKQFEEGRLTLEQIYEHGKSVDEPTLRSGKQEKYETLVALYAK